MIKTFLKRHLLLNKLFIAFFIATLFSFNSAGSFESILNGYKADELKYFSEVAFMSGKLRRWGEPIRISQEGKTATDIQYMEALVAELQPLLGNVPVSYVHTGGNLVIHYSRTIREYSRNYTGAESLPLGYAIPKFSSDNSLIYADIYLHPSLLNDKRNEVLIHEICHMLGLFDHPLTPFNEDNVMSAAIYKNKNNLITLPRLDKAALKLLYDHRMPKNLLKIDFLKKLALLSGSKT
ncbi:MAG TPA: hypothetical protein VGD22_06970 [Sphingobacteriaceae bacterium]